MELDSLKKLLIEEVRDLYSAEKQLVKALPKMAKAASNEELASAFMQHLEETEGQVQRLEQICEILECSPGGKTCAAMKGLVEEGSEMMKEDGEASVIDAGLIACAQRVEHYEIAAYGCARTYAELLGLDDVVELLEETLTQEKVTDEKLTDLAVGVINLEAASVGEEDDEEEIDEDQEKSPRGKGKSPVRSPRALR
jgi:ferritin-like metal-binding protein YciE